MEVHIKWHITNNLMKFVRGFVQVAKKHVKLIFHANSVFNVLWSLIFFIRRNPPVALSNFYLH